MLYSVGFMAVLFTHFPTCLDQGCKLNMASLCTWRWCLQWAQQPSTSHLRDGTSWQHCHSLSPLSTIWITEAWTPPSAAPTSGLGIWVIWSFCSTPNGTEHEFCQWIAFRSPLGEVFCSWHTCRVSFSCGIRSQTWVPCSVGTGGHGQIPSFWWPSPHQWQQPCAKLLNHGWLCENKPLGTEMCVPQQAEFQVISPRHH